jgi:hypothetical protein
MCLTTMMLTLLLSEPLGVDPTPLLVAAFISTVVFVPLLWWGGSKLWRTSTVIYRVLGWFLRAFAIVHVLATLRFFSFVFLES